MIAWSRGSSKLDAEPEQRLSPDFDAFVRALEVDRAPAKELAYFAAPFSSNGNGNGRGHRGKETVQPVEFLILDFDHLTPESEPDLLDWLKSFKGAAWRTHSSTDQAPRRCALLHLSRPASRPECISVNQVVARDVHEALGLALDTAQFKPEQPRYMPPVGVTFAHFWGEPIDVDLYLTLVPPPEHREAPPAAGPHQILEGGRNAALTALAGKLRRIGLDAPELLGALRECNRQRCRPPLSDADVATIARSVARYQPANEWAEEVAREAHWPSRLDLVVLAKKEPIPPQFIIENWLQMDEVSLFAGHGGDGKSAIAFLCAVYIALGRELWGALKVQKRRVGFFSFEDNAATMHYRLSRLCTLLGVQIQDLTDDLFLFDGTMADAVMYRESRDGPCITPSYEWIRETIQEHRLEVIVIDGATDVYGASEINRASVKHFIVLLRRLIAAGGACLLVAHVNRDTARSPKTTQGYSGSTAWHNSVRCRWYVRRDAPEDDEDQDKLRPDSGIRILELQKANNAKSGDQIWLRWNDVFKCFTRDSPHSASDPLDRRLAELDARTVLLEMIRTAWAHGSPIPAATAGPRTSRHVMMATPGFPQALKSNTASSRAIFWRLIEELRQDGSIETSKTKGPDRHSVEVLKPAGVPCG